VSRPAPAAGKVLVALVLLPAFLVIWTLWLLFWLLFGVVFLFILLPLDLLFGRDDRGKA
jgi:hypothetical protein